MEVIKESPYGINRLIHVKGYYVYKHCFRTIWRVVDTMSIADIMSKYEKSCETMKNYF